MHACRRHGWSRTLKGIGFQARACARPTGHPMVLAHYHGPSGAPHVLFYGHYDVQPVDPLSLWENPPFEPKTRSDGKLLGRGTSDDKGQLMTFVEAARAFKDVDRRLAAQRDHPVRGRGGVRLAVAEAVPGGAQATSSRPTSRWCATPTCGTASTPAISTGAARAGRRGGGDQGGEPRPAFGLLRIGGGKSDQHPDRRSWPACAMKTARSRCRASTMALRETPAEIKQMWDGLGFSPEKFLGAIGLSVPAGEKGRSILEQTWARPTARSTASPAAIPARASRP